MAAKDRCVPFSLSIPISQLERLERVLLIALAKGRLQGDPGRLNKLAAALLVQRMTELETEFRMLGLLDEPAVPTQVDAASLARDPALRNAARAAMGLGHALPDPAHPDDDHPSASPLQAPAEIDWDKVP